MIRSKLIQDKRIVNTSAFPKAMDLKTTTNGTFTSFSVHDQHLECKFIENRFTNFSLLSQQFQNKDNEEIEIDYEGEPLLLISLDRHGDVLRTRDTTRLWHLGEVNLTISPQHDVAVNDFAQNTSMEFFNIVLPRHFVRTLCEIYPNILTPYMEAFSLEVPLYFYRNNIPVSKGILRTVNDIQCCNNMGNYAEKYLESKILDCLSMIINRIDGSEKDLSPVNLTLSNKVHDAQSIIMSQYNDPPSLNKLASMVGTNECTLKSAFKHEFGITVFQCLFDHRMKLAAQYLLDSQLSIAEIGLMLGYNYQSHFCTAFQRKYGMSPTEYRNIHKHI